MNHMSDTPPSPASLTWEPQSTDGSAATDRAAVKGGWLYRATAYASGDPTAVSICFVPDAAPTPRGRVPGRHVLEKADAHIADNHVEADGKRIRGLIRDAGPDGITTSGLTARTRGITSKDRTATLAALIEGGDIVGSDINPKGSNGRPGKRYVAVGHWPDMLADGTA